MTTKSALRRVIGGRGSAEERVRMIPSSPWWGEHRSRYHYASRWARGSKVLDVACGTGYGMEILSDAGADLVVGVDHSWEALDSVTVDPDWGLLACRADGVRLPVKDRCFDVIASFETLEHVKDGAGLVAELSRVLRDGGTVFLSTPNALVTKPVEGVPRNPFHVKEYDPMELRDLLRSYFTEVRVLGQRPREAYRMSPWQDAIDNGFLSKGRALTWRVQDALPFVAKDKLSRLLHNRSFYPGEYDFVFEAELVDSAHVLVAICAK